MLEKFTYINSFNEKLEIGSDCLFVNENDLHDFSWGITSKNNKISSFKKGIVSKTIPLILKCESESEGVNLRNRLFEVFEKDVLAMKHGKIQIGDYYLRCFVTGSKKSQYLINKNYMVVSLTIQTDLPEWVKETTMIFSGIAGTNIAHLDYPYDYPHGFKNGYASSQINNTSFVASNFVMTIFGHVQNPSIIIGGHEYNVNVTVGTAEHLKIDSINKTIVLVKANGEHVNCFNNRNRESYIFEKIPSGISPITSINQGIQFNITLLEERSEPKWT